jgi:GNAT superfamily N-acetyltransferase
VTAPLTIRIADAADVDSLLALVHSAYRGPSGREGWTSEADLIDGPRTTRALLAADLDDPSITILVAGDLVGCAAVTQEPGASRASFGLFAVRPGVQRGGVGSALLTAAEDHAREHGATTMEMCVIDRRPELIAWYERRGYARTGETRPFPYGAEGVGEPRGDDFRFAVLEKDLGR